MNLVTNTTHLTWLFLTKRPEELRRRLDSFRSRYFPIVLPHWPLPNLWLGATVENQAMADQKIPHLLRNPARGYFVSMEPLLEPVDISHWLSEVRSKCSVLLGHALSWVIVGGENGPGARPMGEAWALKILHDCQDTQTPFLYKSSDGREKNWMFAGQTWEQFPEGLK